MAGKILGEFQELWGVSVRGHVGALGLRVPLEAVQGSWSAAEHPKWTLVLFSFRIRALF